MATGGPPFFPEQRHLLELVAATRALAAELVIDVSAALPTEQIEAVLARPISLLVLGPVHAGKSTLINALFRAPLAPVAQRPETSQLTVHRATTGPPLHRDHHGLLTVSHESPLSLGEFAVIDTPGTHRLNPEQSSRLADLAESSDRVLAVLPAANPWEPATWDILARLSPTRRRATQIILQHTDLRSSADVEVLVGHLADLAVKRCGMAIPIFPFSAPFPVTQRDAWRTSGSEEIWNHLLHSLAQDHLRLAATSRGLTGTLEALHLLDGEMDRRQRELGSSNRILGQMQSDLDHILSHFIQSLESGIGDLAHALRTEAAIIEQSLHQRLGAIPSLVRLFGRDLTASRTEQEFLRQLQTGIQHMGREDAGEITTSCLAHWQAVTRVAQQEKLDGFCDKPPTELLAQAEERFVRSLATAASERLGGLLLRNRLERELRRRNRTLSAYLATCLIFLTLGAIAGSLHVPWLPLVFCLLATGFLIGGMVTGWTTRPRILHAFRHQVTEACSSYARSLRNDYDEALRAMFRDYSAALHPLHAAISRKESALAPLQQRSQALFLRLKTLEQSRR